MLFKVHLFLFCAFHLICILNRHFSLWFRIPIQDSHLFVTKWIAELALQMDACYPCWMIMEGLRLIFPAVGSDNPLPFQSLSSQVFCWLDKQTSQYLTRQKECFRISKIHHPDGWVDSVQLDALDYQMNNAIIKMN